MAAFTHFFLMLQNRSVFLALVVLITVAAALYPPFAGLPAVNAILVVAGVHCLVTAYAYRTQTHLMSVYFATGGVCLMFAFS